MVPSARRPSLAGHVLFFAGQAAAMRAQLDGIFALIFDQRHETRADGITELARTPRQRHRFVVEST